MKKVKITQIKSGIGRTKKQKDTLVALGFKKMNQSREVELHLQLKVWSIKVKHLLKIEEV
jgi:large subunit ribosomal protein L30